MLDYIEDEEFLKEHICERKECVCYGLFPLHFEKQIGCDGDCNECEDCSEL